MNKILYGLCLSALLFLCAFGAQTHANESEKSRPLVILWDGNLDDVLATRYLINHKDFNVLGICASGTGFSSAEEGVNTALRLLETEAVLADGDGRTADATYYRNIMVVEGSSDPLSSPTNLNEGLINNPLHINIRGLTDSLWFTRDTFYPSAGQLHAAACSCSDLILSGIDEHGNALEILNTGPHTDLADSAYIISVLKNKVYMGGALNVSGNVFTLQPFGINTKSEFNFFLDPKASDAVLRYKISRAPLVVALDATNQLPIDRDFMDTLSAFTTPQASWAFAYLETVRTVFGDAAFYNDANVEGGGYYLWDWIAAAVLEDTACEVEDSKSPLRVNTEEGPADPSGQLYKILNGVEDEGVSVYENGRRVATRFCQTIDSEQYRQRVINWLSGSSQNHRQ
jgi:inosine-uridine nucleoside N-ribohydrolase